MPDITSLGSDPAPSRVTPAPGTLEEGYVSRAPASLGDPAYVVIPAYSRDYNFGPCAWMPRGDALPSQGDRCYVAFSGEQRKPVIVVWEPLT